MIKYSSSPATIRKTFWEIFLTNGWLGNICLLFAFTVSIAFALSGVFALLIASTFKVWPLVLLVLSLLLSVSLYSTISVFWGKANGFFAENQFTDVELDIRENQVEVRLEGEQAVLPWSSVALLRQTSDMIILEFEGLCCLGIPRQCINADDMNRIEMALKN